MYMYGWDLSKIFSCLDWRCREPIVRTKTTPFNLLSHITQHYLTSRTSFTGIPMYSTHQIVVEMFFFKNLPLVAYRCCNYISDILVRAQLPETRDFNNSRTTPGSFRCNSRNCTSCPYIDHGRNKYTFHSTGETYKIKSHITCNTFNVICTIQCQLCNLRYIGETKRRIKDPFNKQRRPILNPASSYIHAAVSEHISWQR